MTWLQTILLALQLIAKLVGWLRERQMLEAGEAKAIAEALEISNDRVAKALAARRAAHSNPPDSKDPYLRD